METISNTAQTPEECGKCIDKIVTQKRRKRRSRKVHKWLGVLITIPLLWISITGVILNHTVDWKLDQQQIESPWLKSHYGMSPSGEPMGSVLYHPDSPLQVIEWDGIIYFNSVPLTTPLEGRLLGALSTTNGDNTVISIVTEYNILQIDKDGNVIEKLDELSLPELPLTAVAQEDPNLFLKNDTGWHKPDSDWLEYTSVSNDAAPLSSIALSPIENQTVRDDLASKWSRGGLPLSRVILDLHSGRFFGAVGKYFYDLVAICTVILSITGIVLFFRKPQRKKKRK